MGKLQIFDDKVRSGWSSLRWRNNALSEKSELETKPAAGLIEKIARKVPPFGLEFRMGVMVARELILPARSRAAPTLSQAACRRPNDHRGTPLHSERTAAARWSWPARAAGTSAAQIALAKTQRGVSTSIDHGIRN